MALAAAIPVLLAWIPLLRRDSKPTWYLAPTLAIVAWGIWGPMLQGATEGGLGIVAGRALSRVLLLVVLPLALLYLFGEGNLVPGAPALGLGKQRIPRSLGFGLVASLPIVVVAALALNGSSVAAPSGSAAVFVAVAAVAEEIFFRGILLIPLVNELGRGGALAVSASSFLLTRPELLLTVDPLQVLPRPLFVVALVLVAVLFGVVAMKTRHVAGAGLGRVVVRLAPSFIPL